MKIDPREEARERARNELDSFFRKKIAEKDRIRDEDVTTEYVRKERERRFYPNLRYDIGSSYGGYSGVGLHFSTLRELEDREERIMRDLEEDRPKSA